MNKIEISIKSYSTEFEEVFEFLYDNRYIFEIDNSLSNKNIIVVYSPNEELIEYLNDLFT